MGEKRYTSEQKEGRNGRIQPGIKALFISLTETMIVSWIVYNSILGMTLFPFVYLINHLYQKKAEKEYFVRRFREEYREFLNGVASLLSGGLSIEQAFLEEEKELGIQYGDDSYMKEKLHQINSQVCLNKPVEDAFWDFSREIGLEEVKEFAEIFIYAKRMGGDYVRNIRHTADKIGENIELMMDIDIITAEKRLEMKIMSIMPVFIVVYIRLTAAGFIMPMYEKAAGHIVMTVCMAVYFFCLLLGKKITEKI